MRKFLFDAILGIFIGIGACVTGIIVLMDKIDELSRRSYGFAEVVNSLVADAKDLIHHLLYGYHHNRSAGAGYGAYNTRDFWYNTTNYHYKTKEEDDEEEAQSGH